jgi:hypothetical protein
MASFRAFLELALLICLMLTLADIGVAFGALRKYLNALTDAKEKESRAPRQIR